MGDSDTIIERYRKENNGNLSIKFANLMGNNDSLFSRSLVKQSYQHGAIYMQHS